MRRARRHGCCVTTAVLLAVVPGTAFAASGLPGPQPPAPHADAKSATRLVVRGVELYKAHDYEGARDVFAQAYALDAQPGTLLNLALSELRAGQPVEAVSHFREYLRATTEPEEKLESVRSTYLPLAESKTARLDIYAHATTEILVDGAALGTMMLAADAPAVRDRLASVLVRAGEHDVTAHDGSFRETQRVTARGGEIVAVHLEDVVPAPILSTASASTAHDASARNDSARRRTKWITVVGLGSGAALAAGVGVAFAIAARQQASNAQTISTAIDRSGSGSACFGAAGSSESCVALNDDTQSARRNWTLSIAWYVGAGVLGTASLATWMLWRPTAVVKGGISVAPALSARTAGLVFHGAW